MSINKKVLIAIIFLAVAAIAYIPLKKLFAPVEVKTERLKRGALEITVSATATGTVKSEREAKISAERTGRVTRLNVEEGEPVKAGTVMFELDLEDAEISLRMARASYERASAMLEETRAMLEPYGVDVEASIHKAEAGFREAQKRIDKFRDLNARGFISELELITVEREYDVAKASYESALAGRKALIGKSEELKAQEAALRESGQSLQMSELNYKYSFIRSPIGGVVSSRLVKLGETVMKGTPVAAVTAMDALYIEAFIDEADIGKVAVGQPVRISMDAYPGRVFAGKVYMISPVVLGARHETRTFEVRTRFDGLDATVKPGMSADVEVVVDMVEGALVLPVQAIVEREGTSRVYVVEGGKASSRKVATGLSNWTYAEITSGLSEGAEVVTNPDAPGLKEGVRIRASGSDNRAQGR